MQKTISRYDYIILFLLLFFAYNTVSNVGLISGDVAPASILPTSIILYHNLFFDVSTPPAANPSLTYAFPIVNGHYVSLFPIVTPVLVTPVYAISWLLYSLFNIPINATDFISSAELLAKSSAAIIAALAGVLFFITAKKLFSKKAAILATFIFAFATSTWAISSQALWQHGTVELLLIAMVYFVVRNEKEDWWGNIFLLGILSGLYIFNRPPDSILLIPVLVYMLWYQRSRILNYVIGGILGGLPFFWYNYSLFGNIFGGYAQNLTLFTLSADFAQQYIGLLIAPNVGLFIFCPILVLSAFGLMRVSRSSNSRLRALLLLFVPAILLQILLYSFFKPWASSAAYCYGPRFLTGFVPVLCIYIGFFLNDLLNDNTSSSRWTPIKKWVSWSIIGGLIILSVGIQGIGVFLYQWSPKENWTIDNNRAWDISDSIIVNSFIQGSQKIPGIALYILPPIPTLIKYSFSQGSTREGSHLVIGGALLF